MIITGFFIGSNSPIWGYPDATDGIPHGRESNSPEFVAISLRPASLQIVHRLMDFP
jgi:hypothetical protein